MHAYEMLFSWFYFIIESKTGPRNHASNYQSRGFMELVLSLCEGKNIAKKFANYCIILFYHALILSNRQRGNDFIGIRIACKSKQ